MYKITTWIQRNVLICSSVMASVAFLHVCCCEFCFCCVVLLWPKDVNKSLWLTVQSVTTVLLDSIFWIFSVFYCKINMLWCLLQTYERNVCWWKDHSCACVHFVTCSRFWLSALSVLLCVYNRKLLLASVTKLSWHWSMASCTARGRQNRGSWLMGSFVY